MVRVKICGITRLEDALKAVECGADALGFVFAESPRKIASAEAAKIIRALGPWVATVGVFVNEDPATVLRIASECRLTAAQLHGDEDNAYLAKLGGFKTIQAFGVGNEPDRDKINNSAADALLFDAQVKGQRGGTGQTFDWALLRQLSPKKPWIVSGGLNPKNVAQAVKTLSPYGVDVSSGVESAPGRKDPQLVKEFIFNAKQP